MKYANATFSTSDDPTTSFSSPGFAYISPRGPKKLDKIMT